MRTYSYSDFKDEHLSRIVPAYFYITTRERNAWWGTESRQYRGRTSLTCTLAAAKKVAEGWRAMGSAFTIQQVPGLHVMSEWTDIALVEFHTSDSYSTWDVSRADAIRPGSSLPQVLDALGPEGHWRGITPGVHSFVSGVLDGEEAPQPLGARAAFRAWSSRSYGGDYLLGWSEHDGRHRAAGVRRLVRASERARAAGPT